MIVFPNAKINIGLDIVERRPDGFHNIQSCFYPVPWKDALEVIQTDHFSFVSTGIHIPGKGNICINAYHLLKEDFDLPPVSIHLHKSIPIGAGLGGGSADGAFMLKLLNEKFTLGLNNEQLQNYAAQLGSDCPFFIENKPAFVEGTGNIFSGINIRLSDYWIVVIYPEIHVNTSQAYKGIIPCQPEVSIKTLLENNNKARWKDLIKNDFEQNADPEIISIKQDLYDRGAIYASMTGSGSAVFGLFENEPVCQSRFPVLISKL